MRLRDVLDLRALLHHLGVDVQPARCVDDHDVGAGALASFTPFFAKRTGSRPSDQTGTPISLTEGAELLDGGGPLEVGRDQERPLALVLEVLRELGTGRRLAGPLDAREHDHCRTKHPAA